MKYKAKLSLLALSVLAGAGCYELASATTVFSSARSWTGTGHASIGSTYGKHSVGLAGQDVLTFDSSGLRSSWTAPAMSVFGGAHVLTSIAQTHSMGFHEHTFVHGNLAGRTDNLDLLYTYQTNLTALRRVQPWYIRFWDAGTYFNVVEICDLAAASLPSYGNPADLESHLFLSFRACPEGGGACAGGVLEVQVDTAISQWWIRSNQQGTQVTLRKPDGTRFSNECMPISVTSYGEQSRQYLAVGDPSWDEISLFDANRLWEGPLGSLRVADTTRNIKDVYVEGRGDGSTDYAFLAVLWRGSTSATLEHSVAVNGTFASDATHLIETVPSDVLFIEGRGLGAEGTSAALYTYGSRVIQRTYQ